MSMDLPRVQPVASHFVDGAYIDDDGGEAIPVIFPATGDAVANVHSATDSIVNQALEAAKAAQPAWAALTGTERGRILRRAADLIRQRNQELSELETIDTGKPIQETLVADATSGADALEYFGGLAGSITGEHIPLGSDFAYTVREPLGVCAGLGAWNYPTQIACWKAAPALACGNTMVFKPSEMTPLCAPKIAEILHEAGLPPGVFNVIQGAGDVGAKISTDSRVAKVSLTGSVPTGKRVYSSAAASMKHVTMELGGKSPILVFSDTDIEAAVGGVILGNFYSSGQVCSNGTRVYVQREIKDKFVTRLLERLSGVRMGDPLDPETNYGPVVSEAHACRILDFIEAGKREGARLLCGGKRADRQGYYIEPTIFDNVADGSTLEREEIFGPVLSLFTFDDENEVIDRANATEFGLSAGVFTRDLARAHRVVRRMQAGTCWVNTYNIAPVEIPFGGIKASGIGRENAKAAIEHYSQTKTVYVGMGDVDAPF